MISYTELDGERGQVTPSVSIGRFLGAKGTSEVDLATSFLNDLDYKSLLHLSRKDASIMFNKFSLPAWAPIPLRLIVGYGFMEHGYAKLVKGPIVFTSLLHALNVPSPHLMAWLTILTELIGGFAVLLGAFVPFVSVPMAVVLLVAIFTVHLPFGFSSIRLMAITSTGAKFGPVGYECNLLYLASIAALVLGGAGPFSIDGFLSKRRKLDLPKRSQ